MAEAHPPRGQRTWPPAVLLISGGSLAFAAAACVRVAWVLGRRGPLGMLAAAPLLAVGFIAGWGAVIRLTGGEKLDDHAWE